MPLPAATRRGAGVRGGAALRGGGAAGRGEGPRCRPPLPSLPGSRRGRGALSPGPGPGSPEARSELVPAAGR